MGRYMSSAFLFCFSTYVYTSIGVYLGKENMSAETDRRMFYAGVGAFILLQIWFALLAIRHKVFHAKLLKSFGRVDPEAIQFLMEDGYKFANGVLSGDLDFTNCKGPDLTEQCEAEQGDFGNPERWVSGGAVVAASEARRPSISSSASSGSCPYDPGIGSVPMTSAV